MASELRVNTINSRTGFGTITVSETGQDLVGITTIENLTTENTLVGAAASFTGNVQIGGVLTYEDVTNIDSVGLITARQGIEIGARPGVAASISVDGNMIVSGISTIANLYVPDKIIHDGDTNTSLRFPAADTVTVETGGSERARIDSSGRLLIGTTTEGNESADELTVASSGNTGITIRSGTSSNASLFFSDATSGADEYRGFVQYIQSSDDLKFGTATEEKVRITSSGYFRMGGGGRIGINTAGVNPYTDLHIATRDANLWLGNPLSGFSNNQYPNLKIISDCANKASYIDQMYGGDNAYDRNITFGGSYLALHSPGGSNGAETVRIVDQKALFGNYFTSKTIGDTTSAIQIQGTDANTTSMSLFRYSANDSGPTITLGKGRAANAGEPDKPQNGDALGQIRFMMANNNDLVNGYAAAIRCYVDAEPGGGDTPGRLTFWTTPDGSSTMAERLRIDDQGRARFNTTANDPADDGSSSTAGTTISENGYVSSARNAGGSGKFGRNDNDGVIINLYQDGTAEGSISVSGSTVSYNGGHLSRWSQFVGLGAGTRPTIYQGTVLSNLDEMCEWDGEENQQLNKTKVSDTVGDKDVAGVFWTWDDLDPDDAEKYAAYPNDFYVAMTGDMVIRVAGSTSVARGDLMESAGDGTAKPQSDDIVRSKTVAKITSTTSTATYADGSKAYPCVLMAC